MKNDIKVGLISLGCPKNKVDAEVMLKRIVDDGYIIESNVEKCDVAIVNTCGFIQSAKEEAVEEIFNLVNLKEQGLLKKIIVTGCFSKRYPEAISTDIPEVDAVLGITQYNEIGNYIKDLFDNDDKKIMDTKTDMSVVSFKERIMTTPSHRADLKIAEGCSNCCAYCAIPIIRGRYRSRNEDSIIDEAKYMVDRGIKEITLVAQDTTRYGMDIDGTDFNKLLKKVASIDNDIWIRILYAYPEMVTEELIQTISQYDNICNYIDIPLQHINDKILKRMNRKSDRQLIENRYKMIKRINPDIAIRTTFITGFPGETDTQFEELYNFISVFPFDNLGVFAYSPEEGTPAFSMKDQIAIEISEKRRDILMKKQMEISKLLLEKKIGTKQKVLIEDLDIDGFIARTQHMAIDIDGIVNIKSDTELFPGEFYECNITSCSNYDLFGEVF